MIEHSKGKGGCEGRGEDEVSEVRGPWHPESMRGYSHIGTRISSSFPSGAPSAPTSSCCSAYELNQALSLSVTVRSCAKSTSTSVSSCVGPAVYVAFPIAGTSLLIEVRAVRGEVP